jgi:hypothetical protein
MNSSWNQIIEEMQEFLKLKHFYSAPGMTRSGSVQISREGDVSSGATTTEISGTKTVGGSNVTYTFGLVKEGELWKIYSYDLKISY